MPSLYLCMSLFSLYFLFPPGGRLQMWDLSYIQSEMNFKVARYSFSGSTPPTFERKLRRHKQRFGQINTTVVLDKDETLL